MSSCYGAIEQALNDATVRAPAVRSVVDSIKNSRGVEKSFLAFITSDGQPRFERIAADHGEDLIQKLFLLNPGSVSRYRSSMRIFGDFLPQVAHEEYAHDFHLPLVLDDDARFAFRSASQIFNVSPETELGGLIDSALRMIATQVEKSLPDNTDEYDSRSSISEGFPPDIQVAFQGFESGKQGRMSITFLLQVTQDWSMSVVKYNSDGELDDNMLNVSATSECTLTLKLDHKGARRSVSINSMCTEFEY